VERKHPAARLLIAGDGPDRRILEALAQSLGLRQAVFLGWRNDAANIMADVDLLAVPSRWEGFGLVTLEAMALAKPVVASHVSALPEIVVPGETGLLVRAGDFGGLADSIDSLLADPQRATVMGRVGRDRARREFTVERMAQRTADVYRNLVSLPKKGHPD
jgi:glycosyltransferase involved in cell wall biosynthesis